jgi:CheY-like chemotaxis protein
MDPKKQIHVLCVDDEPNVLEGLCLHLRRKYDVVTATSGAEGIKLLEADPTMAVVLSDMRMPGMDGTAFLTRAREVLPDAVRILLTGQADLDSAIGAVNQGQIFRFLTKPCPPQMLLASVESAAEQYRLITSERVLLEQTLHGSIKALTDVLALTSPVSFGRATRVKELVGELAGTVGMSELWQVEVAAMLSQLGAITLPQETVEKVYYGQPLTDAEEKMVARIPAVTEQLLGSIPRLEAVREILATYGKPFRKATAAQDPRKHVVETGAHMLRVALDFDALEGQGNAGPRAVDTMRGRADRYDPALLDALAKIRSTGRAQDEVRELPISALWVGMELADDVRMTAGPLLAPKGYGITSGFLERVRNFKPGTVREPVRVIVRHVAT